MTTSGTRIFSDLPIPPGEVLEEELEAIGMTQKELAARLDRPPQVVNEIIRGKKTITPETALELEKVLGIPAPFWVNLEATYQMTIAMNRDREELAKQEKWLREFPVREMEKRGWIPTERSKSDKLRQMLHFLGVASAPAYHEAVGFRITPSASVKVSKGALLAWLRKGELEARKAATAPYNEERFMEALIEARGMTRQPPQEFAERLQSICSNAGVVVLTVPELPKSGAHGATRWLSEDKALIQLSLRYKWQDIYWFTFFHEAGHLLKHRSRKIIVEGISEDEEIEREANEFASDFLIPPNLWDEFIQEAYYTPNSVTQLADDTGIAPGIVVGRLQKEGRLPYNQLSALKGRFEWKSTVDQ